MKYYEAFLNLGCFSFEEAKNIVGLETTTKSLLQQYTKKGYIKKIKKGLYVSVDLLQQEPVVNKFVIASKLTDTATVSYHSAFEYHGYANQVSYHVSVQSEGKFNTVEFNGFTYIRKAPTISSGVLLMTNGVRVTDIERTVVDCIKDFENDMGFEELIQCISAIPFLNEKKMLFYLKEYDNQFLYQKTGYIFEYFKNEFNISKQFLEICKSQAGKSSRYLIKNIPKTNMEFNNNWHLTVPSTLWKNMTSGGDMDADI